MSDPLSALAIAGNVIQFVDFTTRLISRATEIYRNDVLVEYAGIKVAAEQLRKLEIDLQTDARDFEALANNGELQKKAVPLNNLIEAHSNCVECAKVVIAAVDKLKVSGAKRKWKSFRLALNSVIGDNQLENANRRLSEARQQLVLFMLLYAE